MSARSKRTATRTPSPGTPSSQASSSPSSQASSSPSSQASSSPSTGQAGARATRTATRTPSPGTPSSKPSAPSTGQAGARATRTATRTPSPSRTAPSVTAPSVTAPSVTAPSVTVSPSTQADETFIDETFIDETLDPVEIIPEITLGKKWMSYGFKSAVSNQTINFVTELEPVCDACDINSFWIQSHFNNSDPNQNFVKLHGDVVTKPSQVLSLAEAKALMLTLVPTVIPPLEPEILVTPAQIPHYSWVSIRPGVFNLENNRVTGEMLFIAESNFGSDFYNEPIESITQIKSLDGEKIVLKSNTLNFTETERDERIQINETAGGHTSVIVELFAWTQQGLAVAIDKSFTVNLEDPAQIPVDTVTRAPGKMFNQIIAGLFMGGVALAFMSGLKGGKKKK